MKKNHAIYLEHILDCINSIFDFTAGMDEASFLQNKLVQDGVIRNFEVMGEAVKNVTDEIRNKYADVEWKKIAGMRDKLIHDYIGVDLPSVWAAISDKLPQLKKQIEEILEKEKL